MITTDEIDAAATRFGIHTADVERDYVFGWILSGIFQSQRLSSTLVLKGGNALRKGHLPMTRFSNDLDFGAPGAIDESVLLDEFNQVCRLTQDQTGVQFDVGRNLILRDRQIDEERQVFKARLYFNDFAGERDHVQISVRLDLTANDRLQLPVQVRTLIHPYSDATECCVPINVVQLEEALADKLRCLLQRRHSFDLFDLVYGLFGSHQNQPDSHELVRVFLKKTIFQQSPGAAKRLLLGVPFEVFRSFWTRVVCPAEVKIGFDDAVQRFASGIDELFAPFGYGQSFEDAFFPPEKRNPIIEAGRSQCLLRIQYHGIDRLVEPYSPVFKHRKDGSAREYFYAYDQTGGRSSGPGIKSFVAKDVLKLEVTDQPFTPQFTIELSKSGGAETVERFRRTPGLRRLIGRPRRSMTAATTQYTIECPYCSKRFKRKQFSLRLNPHNDRGGYPCPGRQAFQVFD